jgi:hypothetical protein
MSATYDLEISTDLTPAQVRALLALRFKLKWWDETHLGGPATWISIGGRDSLGQDIMEESFGFRPTVSISFDPDTFSDEHDEGLRLQIRAAIFLLDHCRDAMLLFNGEVIVLQRLGGKLILNEDWNIWTEDLMLEGEITVPHEIRPLPSPILKPRKSEAPPFGKPGDRPD